MQEPHYFTLKSSAETVYVRARNALVKLFAPGNVILVKIYTGHGGATCSSFMFAAGRVIMNVKTCGCFA